MLLLNFNDFFYLLLLVLYVKDAENNSVKPYIYARIIPKIRIFEGISSTHSQIKPLPYCRPWRRAGLMVSAL